LVINLDPYASWIATRWLAPLAERAEYRQLVRRGRVLARKNGVRGLTVGRGLIAAQVTTEGGSPAKVTIRMGSVEEPIWNEAVRSIAGEAALAADLLQGRLTERLAAVFEELGHDLFPYDLRDTMNFCNQCDGLCVHIVAVHYDFVRLLDADPLALLEFRGHDRQIITQMVRAARQGGAREASAPAGEEGAPPPPEDGDGTVRFEPGEALVDGFWERGVVPHLAFRVERVELAVDDSLPVVRALGPGPGEVEPDAVASALVPLMRTGRRRIDAILERAETDSGGEKMTKAPDPVQADGLDDLLVAAAHQHGSLTSGVVAKALGIKPREARVYLQWLVEEGRLSVVGRARSTRYLPVNAD